MCSSDLSCIVLNSNGCRTETVPVGSYPGGRSPYGLLDMAGNVSEWCADWVGAYPYNSVDNPLGPNTGTAKIYRGSSWREPEAGCWMRYTTSSLMKDDLGFRVACYWINPDQPPAEKLRIEPQYAWLPDNE